jgi:hypothetical protein
MNHGYHLLCVVFGVADYRDPARNDSVVLVPCQPNPKFLGIGLSRRVNSVRLDGTAPCGGRIAFTTAGDEVFLMVILGLRIRL